MLGYLGYTARFFNIDLASITLDLYANPRYIVRFVSYLRAREVGCGQINKHLSLARKVIDKSEDAFTLLFPALRFPPSQSPPLTPKPSVNPYSHLPTNPPTPFFQCRSMIT